MNATPLPAPEAVPPSSLSPVMPNPERRKSVRTVPEGLIYISFEPDNGGIVLNLSDGGLGFNAVSPVEPNSKLRVSFSADSHKIEAECEVAWTDETRRTGGLRFSGLSPAAREQIRQWTSPASASRLQPRIVAQPLTSASEADSLPLSLPHPALSALRPARSSGLGPFSRGLLTGLLISTLVGGALLFHAYQRQVGDMLVRLGEHFKGEPIPQTAAPVPKPVPATSTANEPRRPVQARAPSAAPNQPEKPAQRATAPASVPASVSQAKPRPQAAPPAPTPVPVEKAPPPSATAKAKLQPSRPEATAAPASVSTPPASPAASPASPATTTPTNAGPGSASKPGEAVAAENADSRNIHVQQLDSNWPTRSVREFADLSAGIPLGKYFELGKFKDEPAANQVADKAVKAGFPAVVLRKPRLLSDSYRVLAGPYAGDREAEAARGSLRSSGFAPKTPATKSRSLTLFSSQLRFDGAFPKFYPIGQVEVSWVAFSPDATVRFMKDGVVETTVHGKWVSREAPYAHDAIVYRTTDRGSRMLLEIQFSGVSQALVLADSGRPILF